MNSQGIKNIQIGLMTSVAATVTLALVGFCVLKVAAAYHLVMNAGGFFVAPFSSSLQFLAHALITGILVQVTINVGHLAFYSFKAACDGTPPQDVKNRDWTRVMI